MSMQPSHQAERSPRSRSPERGRADARAFLAALEAWLLALLLPLVGERAARTILAALPLHRHTLVKVGPYCVHADTAAQFGEAEIRLLIPFLFLIGPGPNRGMRPHARIAPFAHPTRARAPPAPTRAESTPNPIGSPPRRKADSRP